jgi:RNA polymerase sigma-70 factor (ECF subfamily)
MGPYEEEFQELLQQIGAGSQDAARKFLDKYGPFILKVIRRRLSRKLRTKFDSDDFMQDVWASFFSQTPPAEIFASPEAMLGYLAGMARNKVACAVRQRLGAQRYSANRENSLDGSARFQAQHLADSEPTPSEKLMANERWQGMLDKQQPVHQRILALLRLGHTHEEIAELLGLSVKTVQRVLQRLKTRFTR